MSNWHDALSKKHQTRRSNKYGAEKVKFEGRTYDSKGEHEMHGLLLLMEKGKLITDIVHHPGEIWLTKFVSYRPDYRFMDLIRKCIIYVEYKGLSGERWRVIRNLWREFAKDPLQVWMKSNGKLFMKEEIIGIR